MIVDFPETSPWTLLTKIEKEAVQNFEEEEATSFSCALFSCKTQSNDSNPSHEDMDADPIWGIGVWTLGHQGCVSESRASLGCGKRYKIPSTPLGHWFTSYSQAACKQTWDAAQRWDGSWGVYFFPGFFWNARRCPRKEGSTSEGVPLLGSIFSDSFSHSTSLQKRVAVCSRQIIIKGLLTHHCRDLLAADACPVFAGLKNLQWDGPLPASPTDQGNMWVEFSEKIYQGPHPSINFLFL